MAEHKQLQTWLQSSSRPQGISPSCNFRQCLVSNMSGHDLTAYLDCACLRGLLAWRGRRPESGPGIIFSGTGSSCAQPMLRCAIGGEGGVPGCQSCAVALRYGRGNPNWRNNVGLIVRWVQSDGKVKHVQIDCGKTYRDSVLTVYKEHKVLSLDAVFLTHDHADAILGAW